jgi:hypothetical protein
MSQNDFVIANQTAASARADINSALQALASNSLGSSAPSTTYAGQFWFDSNANKLKIRNEGNSAWLDFADVGSSVTPAPGYASQAEAQAGTNNTKLMTPLRTVQGAFPAFSNAATGYTKLASGLMFQWGTVGTSSASQTISYATSFSSRVYTVHATGAHASRAFTMDTPYVKSDFATRLSNFTLFWSGEPSSVTWFAVGV